MKASKALVNISRRLARIEKMLEPIYAEFQEAMEEKELDEELLAKEMEPESPPMPGKAPVPQKPSTKTGKPSPQKAE